MQTTFLILTIHAFLTIIVASIIMEFFPELVLTSDP